MCAAMTGALSMESIGSLVIVGYAGQMTGVQFYVI